MQHLKTIQREIENRTGKHPSMGAIYTALDRLEKRGLISSHFGAPTKERGGRSKRYVKIEIRGREVLNESRELLEQMWEGMEEAFIMPSRSPHYARNSLKL